MYANLPVYMESLGDTHIVLHIVSITENGPSIGAFG